VEVIVALAVLGLISAATALAARTSASFAERSNERFFGESAVYSALEVYKAYPSAEDFEQGLVFFCGEESYDGSFEDSIGTYNVYYTKSWQFADAASAAYILKLTVSDSEFSAEVKSAGGDKTVFTLDYPAQGVEP